MTGKGSVRQGIEERAEALAAPVAAEYGCFIYDVAYVKEGPDDYLNIYIDKEGGVTILDCENVSRKISDLLDEEDFIRDAYTLVVSSPGLGRTLTKDRHLRQSLGDKVEVKLYRALKETGEKELTAVLKAFDADTVTLVCEPAAPAKAGTGKKKGRKKDASESVQIPEAEGTDGNERTLVISRKDIAVMRLYVEW